MQGPVDDGIERQKLANNLTIVSVAGITITGLVMILLSEKHGEAAEHVMTAVLPLFGSWIATVLAYYFAKENLRAATSSVSALVASRRENDLSRIPVTRRMIERNRIVTLSDKFKPVADAALKDITAYLKERAVRRSPILDDKGAIVYMIHLSAIDQFVRDQVAAGRSIDALRFSDLLTVPALKALLEHSFEIVAETATLSDAKAKMENNSLCEDVFVTKTGSADEPILGWITDNALLHAES